MCIGLYNLLCASGQELLCDKCDQHCTGSNVGQWIWTLGVNYGAWWCNNCAFPPPNHPVEIKTIDVEERRAKRAALRREIKTMDDKKDDNDTLEGVGDSLPIDPELGPPSFV